MYASRTTLARVERLRQPVKPFKRQLNFLAGAFEASTGSIVEGLRDQLDALLGRRDQATLELSGYNTRALSAIRGIFGPDSAEYHQAGGIRTSERKAPTRKAELITK